uniref:hypothetical protein n=1 Tax=Galdieria phlegrea TaxID=1389228 RepID=UPI0023D7C757|nr:hypothetical protein P2030_pgp092 [Galdieria phlegrea]WDA99847.1 hypothetical protein GAPH629S_115 [Galdieria phlegrea]
MNLLNYKIKLPAKIKEDLVKRNILKIITGLNNFNIDKISNICIAANKGNATYIDIASDSYLIKSIKQITNLPICASSIIPEELYQSVKAGADLIELGNYESFYEKGFILNTQQIIHLTHKIRYMMPNIPLSVTIPSYLELEEQLKLVLLIRNYNVNFLQTEGKYNIKSTNLFDYVKLALPTLIATNKIANLVDIPIICSSGISLFTSSLAIYLGATGVGVGSLLNNINNESDLIRVIKNLKVSLSLLITNNTKMLYNMNKTKSYIIR